MKDFALGWGSLALINAAIANATGRGPLKYFIFSLFLGPLTTLLLASTYEHEDGKLKWIDLWNGHKGFKAQQSRCTESLDDVAVPERTPQARNR